MDYSFILLKWSIYCCCDVDGEKRREETERDNKGKLG